MKVKEDFFRVTTSERICYKVVCIKRTQKFLQIKRKKFQIETHTCPREGIVRNGKIVGELKRLLLFSKLYYNIFD